MAWTFICNCCWRTLPVNPRCKNQEYCGAPACQRERKRRWQAQKINSDPDYRRDQQEAYNSWCQRNPDYWRRLKEEKRRQAALLREALHGDEKNGPVKMDTFTSDLGQEYIVKSGEYFLIPANGKMDALKVKIITVPAA